MGHSAELVKSLTLRFHKNGVLIIEDAEGTLHVLEPQYTLRNAAKYIWESAPLSALRGVGEFSLKDYKNVHFVKLSVESAEKEERLRSTNWEEDTYFES